MAIVTLHFPDVKSSNPARPAACPYCDSPVLQRWGGRVRVIKDLHLQQAQVYRYRCTDCGRTFRQYPDGVSAARQSQRLMQFAALCWVLGLSLRGTSAILSAFPVSLSHSSVWQDVQALASRLRSLQPKRVRVLGLDGFYPKVHGQEQPTVVAVDLGTAQPLALAAIAEKDWRAVVQWLAPLVAALGVEVIVTDDLKEFALVARHLKVAQQVCHFHLLRWVWKALAAFRGQLDEPYQEILDEIWQIVQDRPAQGAKRLFQLWQALPVRRVRDQQTSALYRLRLLILRLHDHWEQYTLDQRASQVPSTNNGTEQAIGRWRIRSHSTRGFKSWAGLEAAFLACGSGGF